MPFLISVVLNDDGDLNFIRESGDTLPRHTILTLPIVLNRNNRDKVKWVMLVCN